MDQPLLRYQDSKTDDDVIYSVPTVKRVFAGLATEIPLEHLLRLFRAALVIKDRGEYQGDGWAIFLSTSFIDD
jgi:hypothetical protein